MAIPKRDELFNPVLQAIRKLGGSARISELNEEVIQNLHLTEQEIAAPHNEQYTEVQYQLAWVRSDLKAYGVLDNSSRGVWVLTAKGKSIETLNPADVKRFLQGQSRIRGQSRKGSKVTKGSQSEVDVEIATAEGVLEETWREELMRRLLELSPDAFERLCRRLLRESGFVEVRVTGRSGDGGIDGVGIVRLWGLLGFPIIFQCKRYRGSISPSIIRDFRGAMIGRADRGLVMTTGTFSREAKLEATRDGAPPIDLVDGEQFLDKLKEFHLGLDVKMIEKVSVVPDFFQDI